MNFFAKRFFFASLFIFPLLALLWFVYPFFDRSRLSENLVSVEEYSPGYQISACWFEVPENRKVDCGRFRTDELNGRFTLPVVILRDVSSGHQPQPLIYLSGGPGGATGLSAEGIEDWYYWFDEQNLHRDIVLVDQRGTGMSEPAWPCENYTRFVRASLREANSLEEDSVAAFEAMSSCINSAKSRGYDPSNFSSTNSARDMAQLMNSLDYSSWHILGISHGTRIALEWARQDPNGIESMVLDSVYPFDKGILSDWPQRLNNSFENLWPVCESGEACNEAMAAEELENRFWQTLEKLKRQPVSLTVDSWDGDWPYQVIVNDHRYIGAMYTALYDSYLYPRMANSVGEILNGGDYSSLIQIIERSVNSEVDPDFSTLVYFATECSENPELNMAAYEEARQHYLKWMPYTAYDWSIDICKQFAKRTELSAFRQPIASDTPSLILAGGLDPVTPVQWAQDLHGRLENSQLLIAPGMGHGVLSSGACGDSVALFLEDNTQTFPENACQAIR